jgi:malonyl-CoA O-methyltransferase
VRAARRARAWSAVNPGNVAIRSEISGALLGLCAPELAGDGRLLDVGCGTGWWLSALAGSGVDPGRLFGLDASAERVAAAAARAPGASVVCGDARALPWEDGTFAAVFLLLVLSSLGSADAVRAALREVRRVVRPGGAVAVWEPRVPTPWNRSTRWIRRGALRGALGHESAARTVTVLPPLARRVGGGRYPALARVGALRTHRVAVWRTVGA